VYRLQIRKDMMTHVLAAFSLLLLVRDPLENVVVGGAAGLAAVFICAALLGCALNAFTARDGHHFRTPTRSAATGDGREAAEGPAAASRPSRLDDARDHRERGHTGLTAHGTA
jgi:hypothetical protein